MFPLSQQKIKKNYREIKLQVVVQKKKSHINLRITVACNIVIALQGVVGGFYIPLSLKNKAHNIKNDTPEKRTLNVQNIYIKYYFGG